MNLLQIMHLITAHAIGRNRSQGSQAKQLLPWLAPAQQQPQPASLPASCLEFHDPCGGLPSADTKAHKTKAARCNPQAAKSTFVVLLLLNLWSASTRTLPKTMLSCSTFPFPAHEKSGAGQERPPGSYFKSVHRDVVGGGLRSCSFSPIRSRGRTWEQNKLLPPGLGQLSGVKWLEAAGCSVRAPKVKDEFYSCSTKLHLLKA